MAELDARLDEGDLEALSTSLADLDRKAWMAQLEEITDELGYFQPLGRRHFAGFVDAGSTLVVTFETIQGMQALSDDGQPLGWKLVREDGWSHLLIGCDGDTWFRAPEVYGYFDRLVDEGFFEDFERVLFYGAGPCAYAAAAFSVAAPGARVVAVQPQATLDPRVTEWDDRFLEQRMTSFTDRYGYAPDMLDAAMQAFVLYDPAEMLDAMHAALFTKSNVQKLRMRYIGGTPQTALMSMKMLYPLLRLAAADKLDRRSFAQIWRARRDNAPYLRNLLNAVNAKGREELVQALCRNVVDRLDLPRFRRRLRKPAQD